MYTFLRQSFVRVLSGAQVLRFSLPQRGVFTTWEHDKMVCLLYFGRRGIRVPSEPCRRLIRTTVYVPQVQF